MTGFAALHRQALDNPLLDDASRLGAWTWLILRAAWKPTPFRVGGAVVTLERGQLCVSIRQLAEAWGWSKSSVDRFLTRLENGTMIEREAGQGRCIITICNYCKYQDSDKAERDSSGTPTGTRAGQQRDTKEQGNKGTSDPKGSPSRQRSAKKPDDVPDQLWADVLSLRKAKRAPLTESAFETIKREADRAGWPLVDALEKMVARGWQGFEADWVEGQQRPNTPAKPADPNGGNLLRQYQAGEISFEEFDRLRKPAEPRKTGSGPPRPIGEIVQRVSSASR